MPFDGADYPVIDLAPSPALEAERIILATGRILDRAGWCKGLLRSSDGRYCIRGALRLARHEEMAGSGPYWVAKCYLRRAIGERQRGQCLPIIWRLQFEAFNDRRSTTREDIRWVIARAAEMARNG